MQNFQTLNHFNRESVLDPAPDASPENESDAPEPSRGRVLVMDDEMAILELTARVLRIRGYDVETVLDGESAIAEYRAAMDAGCPFDLMILDLTVPDKMGGYEAFKAVRSFDPRVKAIVSSGYSNEPIVTNFRDYGLAGVAPKPYKLIELIGAVEKALG
jgi:CheY-like chemotaxis protein